MSIFGSPVKSFVGSSTFGPVVSGDLDVPDGALIVVLALASTAAGVAVITDPDNTYVPATPQVGSRDTFQWAYCLSAVADAALQVTANWTPGSGLGLLFVWVFPITGGTALFDTLFGNEALSGTGNQFTGTADTAGADEVGCVGLFDSDGIGGWSAVSPATLDSAGFGSGNQGAAGHISWSSTQTNAKIGLSNTGTGLGDIAGIAFMSAAPPTFSISGSAGVAGATVAYSGTSSGSVMADGSGNYEIDGLADGDYVITPSKAGYTFSPTSHSETVDGENITGVDFTATANPTAPHRSTRSK